MNTQEFEIASEERLAKIGLSPQSIVKAKEIVTNDVVDIIEKSPTLVNLINIHAENPNGGFILFSNDKGAKFDQKSGNISINKDEYYRSSMVLAKYLDPAQNLVGVLAHELMHGLEGVTPSSGSWVKNAQGDDRFYQNLSQNSIASFSKDVPKDAFIQMATQDEAFAVVGGYQIYREIKENGGPEIHQDHSVRLKLDPIYEGKSKFGHIEEEADLFRKSMEIIGKDYLNGAVKTSLDDVSYLEYWSRFYDLQAGKDNAPASPGASIEGSPSNGRRIGDALNTVVQGTLAGKGAETPRPRQSEMDNGYDSSMTSRLERWRDSHSSLGAPTMRGGGR